MIADVFLRGSDPKGGPLEAARNLAGYARQLLPSFCCYGSNT